MDFNEHFNKDYFLFELKKAGVIKNDYENEADSLTLEKVPNITIGLVLATKSLKHFANNIILNWIRKGRKVTTLIEKQFDLYDKLFIYLQNNVYTEDDIQNWKQLLDETKYVFPEKESIGWSQIFGFSPELLEKVDPEMISNASIVQQQKDISDAEDEETRQDSETQIESEQESESQVETVQESETQVETEQESETQIEKFNDESCKSVSSISNACFSHEYYLSLLQDVGVFIRNDIEQDIPTSLVKVPNITIELVLAAKAVNYFKDETILMWIRKGRKVTPLIEKQFALYEKLSDYLMNHIEIKDIEKWKLLFNAKYVFPLSEDDGWALIFGEIPELCHKIDKALESQNTSKQMETSKSESEEEQKSHNNELANQSGCRKGSQKDDDDEDDDNKDEDNVDDYENERDDDSLKKSEEDNLSADVRDDKIITEFSNISNKSSSELCGNVKSHSDVNDSGDSDDYKSNTETSNLSENRKISSELSEKTISKSEGDELSDRNDNKKNTILSNESDKSSSELCEVTIAQIEGDDSSDSDDDGLEDLFDAVGAELTAAEQNDEELPIGIQLKNENGNKNTELTMDNNNEDKERNKSNKTTHFSDDEDYLSGGNKMKRDLKQNKKKEESNDDIYDVDNLLDYEYNIDSDTEIQENREDGSITTKEDKESTLKEKEKEDKLIRSGIIKKSQNGTFMCLKCKYASRNVESTKKHITQHTGGLADKKDNKVQGEREEALIKSGIVRKSEGGTFMCLKCKYASINLENTEKHVNGHQGNMFPTQTAKENPISRVVHIKTFAKEVTEAEILPLAVPFGEVLKKVFFKDRGGNTNKGNLNNKRTEAYLEMSTEEIATAMVNKLNLCPVQLRGHQVVVGYSKHKDLSNDTSRPGYTIDILTGIKTGLKTSQCGVEYIIPGFCFLWNKSGHCIKKKCKWPHKCNECGEKHPAHKCFKRKKRLRTERRKKEKDIGKEGREKEKEIEGKFVNDSDDDEETINKSSRLESENCVSRHKNSDSSPEKDNESEYDGECKKPYKIAGMCFLYNAKGRCNKKACRYPHRCDECGGDHPKSSCTMAKKRKEKENESSASQLPVKKEQNMIPGMCHEFNNVGRCVFDTRNKPCKYTHRCDQCGGDHPRSKCSMGKPKSDEEASSDSEDEERKRKFESETTGIDLDGERTNKRSRFESKHLESSSNRPSNVLLESGKQCYEMKVSRSRAGFILGQHGARITKIRKKTTATINISKKTNSTHEQVITIEGSSDEVQKALYMIDNEELSTSIPQLHKFQGMCNAFNVQGKCGFETENKPCKYTHRCDQCGGDHPRSKCSMEKSRPGLDNISGKCSEYNLIGTCNSHKFCKMPHRCDECDGDHPKIHCTIGKQRTGIGKELPRVHQVH